MAEIEKFEVGMKVRFLGYDDKTPEDQQFLEEGEVYEIEEVGGENGNADDEGAVRIDNPQFDPKKKVSKNNPETVLIDVYAEEVELVEDEPEEKPARTRGKAAAKEETKAAPKAAAKGKAKAAEKEEAEEKPAKGKATAKASAKAAPAAKGKTKAAAKPAKEEKEEKVDVLDMDIENEDEEIVKLVEEAGDELLDLALETVEESSGIDYRLGGILYHVRKSKAYESLDKRYKQKADVAAGQLSGFQLYTQEQLGVDYRKAMELISIYVNFNLAGISGEKVAEIGWTKASKIARVLQGQVKAGDKLEDVSKVAEELVEQAGELSVTELSETIKESYSGGTTSTGEPKKKTVKFLFKLFEDQAEGVKNVLEATAKSMNFKKLDQAFEHIIMEWAAEHPLEEPEAEETVKSTARAAGRAGAKASGKARASARA